jgi:Tfp pilus assembly protein PilV
MSLHATQGYPSQRLEVARMALAPGWQWFNASLPATLSPPSYPASPVVQYPPTQPAIPSIAVPSVQTIQATQVVDLISRMNAMNVNGVNGPMLNPQDPNHVQYAAKLIQQSQLAQQQQQQQMYAQAMQSQAGAPRPPAYTVPPSGLPVNTANGSIRTEARGVFISGLSYKAKSKDIEAAFSRAGEISSCEVQKDVTTGKSKGKATVRYTSAAGAARAISMFDKKKFMGMEISVRADTDRTVVSPPPVSVTMRTNGQPIIVDGSNVPGR